MCHWEGSQWFFGLCQYRSCPTFSRRFMRQWAWWGLGTRLGANRKKNTHAQGLWPFTTRGRKLRGEEGPLQRKQVSNVGMGNYMLGNGHPGRQQHIIRLILGKLILLHLNLHKVCSKNVTVVLNWFWSRNNSRLVLSKFSLVPHILRTPDWIISCLVANH